MKQIKDFEGIYSICKNGDVIRLSSGKILKSQLNSSGYLNVVLCKYGKLYNRSVHRLVANAYISNIDNKPQVNHIDGDKKNNNVNNLEWVTASENQKHSYKVLNRNRREKKLINNITGQLYKSVNEAALLNNIKRTTLSAMLIGQNRNKSNITYINYNL